MNHEITHDTHDADPIILTRRGKIVLGATGLLLTTGAVLGIHNAIDAPHFSETTTTFTVGEGEGLNDAAATIDGISKIDIRDATHYMTEDMPENKATVKNGLHPGEILVVPESVKP